MDLAQASGKDIILSIPKRIEFSKEQQEAEHGSSGD
jgi:hypothetical protein